MNADLKQQIEDVLAEWHNSDDDLFSFEETGDRMAALLQELADAQEAEPFAVIHLDGSFVHVEFKQTIAGTGKFEVYAAPPAPSVPDGWKLVPVEPTPEPFGYFKAEPFGWTDCAETDDGAIPLYTAPPAPSVPDGWIRAIDEAMVVHHIGIADRADSYEVAKKKLNALLAINSDIARDCSEAPADVVRDAEPFAVIHLDGSFVHVEFKQSVASSGKFTVYTAPQPPKLSDERIFEIATRFQDGGDFGWDTNMCEREQLGFARAIEREILGIEQEQSE